jgi:hypothetical protein
VVLPAARRAGIRALGAVVPPSPDTAARPGAPPEPDFLLAELVARLKPREIVVLGDASAARGLAALARRHCAEAVTVSPGTAEAGLGLRALPSRHDLDWLAGQGLAVDLIHLGRHAEATGLLASLRTAWRLLRPGGIVLAEAAAAGAVAAAVEGFAAETGAKALPAPLDNRHYWILEKP